MKRVYLLRGLTCPNCSAKIEQDAGELNGVRASSVNLMKQTLTVESEVPAEFLLKNITEIVRKHEPDVEVSELNLDRRKADPQTESGDESRLLIVRLAVGAVLFGIGIACAVFLKAPLHVELAFLIVSYLVLGGDVVWRAVVNISKGRVFDEHFLMTVSTIGAFVIGEYPEAVAVMLFYQVGELFQTLAVRRSARSISKLMDLRPDSATVLRNGERIEVSPETVSVGETILVTPGGRIPLDGVVLEGDSMLDTRALTGESVPRPAHPGDAVLSGCVNQDGILTVRTTKSFGESTASKIIDLVENASGRKAKTEHFITTFARYYTPAVVAMAAVLAVLPPLAFGGDWTDWIRRGFVFLVVSCPCALVISIPLTFIGGIGAASKRGVLVKGGNCLEALNKVSMIVFDKTGTLTKGTFQVTDVLPASGVSSDQVLEYAARAERFSSHPIAKSILAACGRDADPSAVADCREIAGQGIRAVFGDETVLAGSAKLMRTERIEFAECELPGTKVYVAVNGRYAGCVVISDELKPDSARAVAELKRLGVERTVMLTGDVEAAAKAVAEELRLDEYHAQLLPVQKVELIERLDREKRKGSTLAFVGDGINDAPVLARADIGIAMGGLGSDAAIEAADVVLMTDEPSRLVDAIAVARRTRRIVVQNIAIAIGIKCVFLVLGALGVAGMWEAVFGDVGVTILAVLNAMRALKA